jgi:hypothetical protein
MSNGTPYRAGPSPWWEGGENNLPRTPFGGSLWRAQLKGNKIFFIDIFRHLREKIFQTNLDFSP